MYAAGISALAAGRFDTLRPALLTPVYAGSGRGTLPIVVAVMNEIIDIEDQFKRLPDMKQKYVPRSEHIYKRIQPILEDQLFLGRSYDNFFDEFEMMLALTYADSRDGNDALSVWGPPGRFIWKERGRFSENPVYSNFTKSAKELGEQWNAIRAGFFKSSAKRFADIADGYSKRLASVNLW